MIHKIKYSISNKLMVVIMATTVIALLAYGVIMLVYDIRAYHDALIRDMATQANIIAEVSAPALEFDDPATAKANLDLLRTRPMIVSAALYTSDGVLFAEYSTAGASRVAWREEPQAIDEYTVERDRIQVWKRIVKDDQVLGTIYIRARYQIQSRLIDYAIILACVMAASLGLATLIATWLRGAVTKPIYAVTDVARRVMQSRDFSLRAAKFTEDEIGVLVEAFNDMLSEVERRARALEDSNRSLEHEMGVRLAAEDALRLADRRKDEFLATLAHELRNPLAPLINSLRLLQMPDSSPRIRENAQTVMDRQLRQMVRLVDDLLDVSRITTGKLAITRERVDIQSVMQDAVEASGAFIAACGHELDVHMPREPVYIDADTFRLAQVFSNLLNNAAKYTNAGGVIRFEARVERRQLVVDVSDNGIGIAPDMLQHIFVMFTQVDQSLERTHAGLGVGLALSKHLVELHEGALAAFSNGPGRGSTFRVSLDLSNKSAPHPNGDVAGGKLRDDHHRVLLVDDNVDYISTMATLLTTLGHDVRVAHNGMDAQTIVREFQPEFAFLDIGLPGLNGYDLARILRGIPETADCVMVAVTGWGQEKDRQMSRDAGFDHHLVKPVELTQVMTVIEAGPDRQAHKTPIA